MNRLGYRAANVGERDLVMGYDEFRRRTAGAKFEFVSANVVRKDDGKTVFEPYTVLDVARKGGKPFRVGVIGVVRFNPIFLKAGPDGSNLVIARPEDQVAKFMPELRDKADVVILLAAMHEDDARAVVKAVPGIDLVVGAYGGMFSTREEREGDVLMVYSGSQGKRIGETRLYLDGGKIADSRTYVHFLNASYPGDPEMDRFVETIHGREAAPRAGAGAAPGAGGAN